MNREAGMDRRTFLQGSLLAVAGLATARASAQNGAPVEVTTPLGRLRGTLQGGVRVFRGVPFARPPVGPLRFRPTEPVAAWTGVREALEFAPSAPQPGEPRLRQDEDCLYLNVWAPASGGPHPVFVWIHGGGFTGGSPSAALFDGTGFAQAGIVLITVAYRLGMLGFLDVEPILGSSYAGSANNALRDLITALRWVKTNVGAFGGDPHRVTVGGESAGAKLTDLLMGVPEAQGLFQQMISESGGAERILPRERSADVARAFATSWTSHTGLKAGEIATAPAKQLIGVQEPFMRDYPLHFPLRPEIDGKLIARPPLTAIRAGSTRGKRLLLGTQRDESALFLGPHPEGPPKASDLGNLPLDRFQAVEEQYKLRFPQLTPEQRMIRSVTAEEYWIPSMRVVEAHLAGGGGAAYVYRMDFPGEGNYAGLAFHSYDLRFVWNHFGTEKPTAGARALATSMGAAWASFVRGEAPSGPGLPPWPAYNLNDRPTMLLDASSRVVNQPNGMEEALWQGLLEG